MNFIPFFNIMATLFLMLFIGYVSGKLKIIDEVSSKKLSHLILEISQPALLINSLMKMEFSRDNLFLGLKALLCGVIVHIALAAVSSLACRKVKDLNERKITGFAMMFGNCGFIGIPILESLYGPTGAFMASFFIVTFNIAIWTWGLHIFGKGRTDIKVTLKKALINKGTVPSAIGFILFLLPFDMPLFFTSTCSYMASLCTPVSVLVIGALLSREKLSLAFTTPKIYYVCAMKLIALPLLTCVIMKLIGFDSVWIIFTTAMVAMPSAATVSMFSEKYDVSPNYSARCVGVTSLLCTVLMPSVILLANYLVSL